MIETRRTQLLIKLYNCKLKSLESCIVTLVLVLFLCVWLIYRCEM
jgi:hypothetical protein